MDAVAEARAVAEAISGGPVDTHTEALLTAAHIWKASSMADDAKTHAKRHLEHRGTWRGRAMNIAQEAKWKTHLGNRSTSLTTLRAAPTHSCYSKKFNDQYITNQCRQHRFRGARIPLALSMPPLDELTTETSLTTNYDRKTTYM